MDKYNTGYKDYSQYVAIMISTDRGIFNDKSAVRKRMVEHAGLYKQLHIIIFSTIRSEQINISDNCFIYSTGSFSRLTYIFNAKKIGKMIINDLDESERILITCQDPFETSLIGRYLANLRKNAELLLQIHTDLFSPYFTDTCIGFKNAILNKIRIAISKYTLPKAQVIRVVSKKIADSLMDRGISVDKIILKPIHVDTDAIKNSLVNFDLHKKFPQFRKIILMVSRLESEKNIDGAIRAFALILEKIPDAGLIIVGSGSQMSKLRKLAFNLDISSNVVFLGWQTDIVSYYKGCDIFLVTSWYEGYGMVFKEAQSAGCKIVSTDVGIAREVGAEIVGWKVEEIASRIESLLIKTSFSV